MSDVRVVFNADTSSFVANVDNASKATAKSAEAVATAKNTIVASFKMQVEAAKEVGASHQELEAIQRRAASMMANVSETNATKIINSLDRISQKNKAVAAELGALKIAAPLPSGGGHETSDRMATSAVVRGAENGNPGIRSIENFITTIPGAAAAMQTLFPIIGAAGLAGLLIDMGEKGYEAFKKVQQSAELTRASFDALHDKSAVLIDDKEIENQKIQDQIDKLSGHPNNGLASALLEAKKMSDQLLVSLRASGNEMKQLFEENSTGNFGKFASFFNFGEDTSGQENELNADHRNLLAKVHGIRDDFNKAMNAAPDEAGRQRATDAYNTAIHKSYDSLISSYEKEDARLKGLHDVGAGGYAVQHGKHIANIEGAADILRSGELSDSLDQTHSTLGTKLGGLKQDKSGDEAAQKAAEKQRNQWDIEHDQMEQAGNVSAADEVAFWTKRVNAAGVGSLNYKDALDKQTAVIKEQRTKDAEAAKQSAAQALKDQRDSWDIDHDAWVSASHRTSSDEASYWAGRLSEAELGSENYKVAFDKYTAAILAGQKEAEAAQKARNKATQEQGQQAAAYAMASLAIQEQTGQISRQDAALQTANIHAEQYRQQMAALKAELAQQQKLDPNSAATVTAQAAVTKAAADRSIQVMQDAANTAATSWQGALKDANANWVQDSQDSAKQVVALYQQTLNGLNDNLSDLMVGKKSNFAGMFQGIGKTLGTDGLKRIESPILGALGVGKADGSASNPFSVKVVGGGMSPLSMQSLGKSLFPGSDDSSVGGTPKGVSGFFSNALGFVSTVLGGHRALGGNVQAGVTYDVGEMGREEFTPSTNGTITPHNQTSGGNAYYNVNVANGVTPEQMNMHMRAALQEFHPVVVRDSVKATHAYAGRNPTTRH